ATVVRPRESAVAAAAAAEQEHEIFSDVVPPPAESFNPWRVVVPSIAGLLIVFAVVFALTRNTSSQPAANDNTAPLAVDPAGQPVKPAQTPTGAGEQGVVPNAPPAPPTDMNANVPSGLPPEQNPNRNENVRGAGANQNENRNGQPGENGNKQAEGADYNPGDAQPSPSPGKNSNKHIELPTPGPKATPDSSPNEPPPMPTPKKEATPKPTSSGAGDQESSGGASPLLP
ncbi:MAG TPA: hypothetical protein VEV81_13075, partial [Pyrinomonadaceae bacterium]|nr:hypothetical protein [Pyrinomonadaceae bacterium]